MKSQKRGTIARIYGGEEKAKRRVLYLLRNIRYICSLYMKKIRHISALLVKILTSLETLEDIFMLRKLSTFLSYYLYGKYVAKAAYIVFGENCQTRKNHGDLPTFFPSKPT